MPRDADDEIQELEFDSEPADEPVTWEDEDELPPTTSPGEVEDDIEQDAPEVIPDATATVTGQDEPAIEPDKRTIAAKTKRAEKPARIAVSDNAEPSERPIHPPTRWARLSELCLEYKFWMNPRSQTGLDDEKIGALAASILRGTKSEESGVFAGIEDPLEVVQINTSAGVVNLITDGQRRYLATKFAKLGDDTWVPVVDLEPEPVKWTADLAAKYLARALDKVGTREGLSSFELSESAERLRSSTDPDTGKDFTLDAVAATVGRSASWVSKILAARERATDVLLHSWRKGELTDEQFKDLAAVDRRAQKKAASDVVEARKSGDVTGARTVAKEKKALAAAKEKAKDPAPEPKKAKKGEQAALNLPPPKKSPPFAVVEDMLETAVAHPPTHDYVRGMMDALKWDRGLMDAANFAKPWHTYLTHVVDSKARPKKIKK